MRLNFRTKYVTSCQIFITGYFVNPPRARITGTQTSLILTAQFPYKYSSALPSPTETGLSLTFRQRERDDQTSKLRMTANLLDTNRTKFGNSSRRVESGRKKQCAHSIFYFHFAMVVYTRAVAILARSALICYWSFPYPLTTPKFRLRSELPGETLTERHLVRNAALTRFNPFSAHFDVLSRWRL